LPLLNQGQNVLLVAHGNSIRALMKYLDSISDNDVSDLEMLFGQIVIYQITDQGLKDTSYIEKIDTSPPNA